jgi:UDP-N-acetylmuramoyl-L-alanyl-D-glutamate--2,6-diaminopimelate ligase
VDATFPLVRLAEVAAVVGGEVRGAADTLVRDAASDSREVPAGSLFFCLRGEHLDGHAFADAAVAAGAAALVVEHPVDVDVPQVLVGSVREAIGPMSAAVFGRPGEAMTVVGITGTNGKTTGTYLLESVFRSAGWTPGVIGTTGLRIDGVAEPLARTTPEAPDLQRVLARMRHGGVRAIAMEISSHALAQHRTDGLLVDAALFTNLSQDHLDFHPSMEAYFESKRRLFTPTHARRGLVNADDAWGRRLLADPAIATTSFAVDAGADLRATEIEVGRDGVAFQVDGVAVRSPLRGRFNVHNCLGVVAVARALGVDDAAIVEGIANLRVVPGRMEPVDAGQPFTVVVDYAHTPDSIHSVLRGARPLAGNGQMIVVFGCGGDRDRAKRPSMGRAASDGADLVIVTSDNPRSEDPLRIIDEIVSGVPSGTALIVEPDRRVAIERAIDAARAGDVVVIAGKGHESTQEVGDAVLPFDDRIVARAALEARQGSR